LGRGDAAVLVFRSQATGEGVLFSDMFNVMRINPEGKKFDRGECCGCVRVRVLCRWQRCAAALTHPHNRVVSLVAVVRI
jgi:hypothetical protein